MTHNLPPLNEPTSSSKNGQTIEGDTTGTSTKGDKGSGLTTEERHAKLEEFVRAYLWLHNLTDWPFRRDANAEECENRLERFRKAFLLLPPDLFDEVEAEDKWLFGETP